MIGVQGLFVAAGGLRFVRSLSCILGAMSVASSSHFLLDIAWQQESSSDLEPYPFT